MKSGYRPRHKDKVKLKKYRTQNTVCIYVLVLNFEVTHCQLTQK